MEQLYDERYQATRQIAELRPLHDTVVTLGPGGMSADEWDEDSNAYLIRQFAYRAPDLTRGLRTASRSYRYFVRDPSGAKPRVRLPSTLVDQTSEPPPRLISNGIDDGWKGEQSRGMLKDLRMRPAIDLRIPQSLST